MRCKKLFERISQKGYKESRYIIVNHDNLIQDGQHRASWLMAKYGEDAKIKVLRIYALKDDEHYAYFPFDLVPPKSRLILYGAGVTGTFYEEELRKTGYAKVLFALDRKPENWNKRKKTEIPCYFSDYIKTVSEDAYDYVVIAVQNKKMAEEILNYLVNCGVLRKKIIARVLGQYPQ